MLGIGSVVFVGDNTGVSQVRCIGVLHKQRYSTVQIGDIIVGSIIRTSSVTFRRKHLVPLLIIQTKRVFRRKSGIYIHFAQNMGVLIGKNNKGEIEPLGSRILNVIPFELKNKHKKIGAVAKFFV